jgi:protein tyrosine/serine phosphatase
MRTAVLCLAIALSVGACGVPENDTSNPTANWDQVSDGIFRGARPDSTAMQRFSQMSFKTVLNLEDDDGAIADELKDAQALGLTEVLARMTGSANPDNATVVKALATLADPATHPIFVHCKKGQDRTGAIVAMHRVFNEGWSAHDAHDEMIDHGFDTTLKVLESFVGQKTGLDN